MEEITIKTRKRRARKKVTKFPETKRKLSKTVKKNTSANQVGENRPIITGHMHREENDKFKELLFLAAQNGNNGFDMTEPEHYSLELLHFKELLAGAHFKILTTQENINDEYKKDINNKMINAFLEVEEASVSKHLKFIIKELEMTEDDFSIRKLLKIGAAKA